MGLAQHVPITTSYMLVPDESRCVGEHRTNALAATANAPLTSQERKKLTIPSSKGHDIRLSPHQARTTGVSPDKLEQSPEFAPRGLRESAPTKGGANRAKATLQARRGPAVPPGA
jgi:hypothetical protein